MPTGKWESVNQAYHLKLLDRCCGVCCFFGGSNDFIIHSHVAFILQKQSETTCCSSCPAESLEDSRSVQRRSEVATSPRRNMMSEVIVKASHLERINGVHGGSCVTRGSLRKQNQLYIYNYDYRRLLKPRWDWMTGKQFLPKKTGNPQKTKWISIQLRKCWLRGPGRAMGFAWLHYVFYLHPQTWARGHGKHQKTWENMADMDTFWTSIGSKRTQERKFMMFGGVDNHFCHAIEYLTKVFPKILENCRSLHSICTRYSD